jgi:uncharacterized protein
VPIRIHGFALAAAVCWGSGCAEQKLDSLGDGWVGGFIVPSVERVEPSLGVDFASLWARTEEEGRCAPIEHGERRGARVRFEAVLQEANHRFEGRLLSPDQMEGEVSYVRTPTATGAGTRARREVLRGSFELFRPAPYDRADFTSRMEGTYTSTSGASYYISARAAKGRLFTVETGRTHALFPIGGDRYAIGPGLATAHPRSGTLDFAKDGSGRVAQIRIELNGRRAIEARRDDPSTEEIRFTGKGHITLVGTLYRPKTPGLHPAIVNVHGSGRTDRSDWWTQAMVRVFLKEGCAVFFYDKRGAGQSGGEYVGPGAPNTNNVSPENLALLADDAVGAVSVVLSRPDIDKARIGLFGISQAGWIIPIAAAQSREARFVVILSGPTVHTSLEAWHSRLLLDGQRPSEFTLEEVDRVVQLAPREGFDPGPSIARLTIPGLWIYGSLDTSIPVPECLRALDRIKKDGGHDLEVVTIAGAGHSLFSLPRDLESELLRSPGFAAEELAAIRRWLRDRVVR